MVASYLTNTLKDAHELSVQRSVQEHFKSLGSK